MGGSSSGQNQPQSYDYNQEALKQFVQTTQNGQQYQAKYAQTVGAQVAKLSDGSYMTLGGSSSQSDVSDLITAFQNWQKDQTNANSTWQNYATLVAQQGGGQGQQTILGNPASSTVATALGGGASSRAAKPMGRL